MAMSNYVDHQGVLNEYGVQYYRERAKGGFGLIIQGCAWADMEIDIMPSDMIISPLVNPGKFTAVASGFTERVHTYGTKIFAQITAGPGRNAPGMRTPSELPMFWADVVKTQALTVEEIKKKIEYIVKAAVVFQKCGYDGIEIHAIHWGYLLDEFALSFMNYRTDEYGGTLANRLRFAREIFDGIKQACGADFPVGIRMGMKSFIKGFNQSTPLSGEGEVGRTVEEAVEMAKLLESYGLDYLSVNSGIYDSYWRCVPSYAAKGENLLLSAELKKEVKIPVMVAGKNNDPYLGEKAILEGRADAIVIGRGSLADPYFPRKAEMGQPEKIRPCIACNIGCIGNALMGKEASCAVNPVCSREASYHMDKVLNPKKVVVVGGGVAGMEIARTATLRGHDVTLIEKGAKLGGHLIPAGTHPFKDGIADLNKWYQQELKALHVAVKLETEATPEMIKGMKPDVVVLAAGSVPVMPNLPGIDHEKVFSSIDAILGNKKIGGRVVVAGGGLVGCEIALEMAQQGKKVTIVEALDSILAAGLPVPLPNLMELNLLLAENQVQIQTGSQLDSINDSGAVVLSKDGGKQTIEADSVIIAIGFKAVESLASELYGCGIEIYEIGDGRQVANIKSAIWDAYEVARGI